MYFRVNLKMRKPTLCCCFIWVAFIELNFIVACLLIRKTWDGRFVGNSVHLHPTPHHLTPFCQGEGGWAPYQILKKRGLRVSQFLDGGYWEREGDLFNGGFSFYIKNKLKSEMFFFVITKNWNWEIVTENLVTCKRWDGNKEAKF